MEPVLKIMNEQLAELRKTCSELLGAAEAEQRDLTGEENQLFEQNEGRIIELKDQIHKREFVEKDKAEAEARQATAPTPVTPTSEVVSTAPAQRMTIPAQPRLSKRLKAFKGPEAYRNAMNAGRLLLATVWKNHSAQEWCNRNGLGNELRAMSTSVNSKGGFLVPSEFEQAVIDLREEYGVARQECRVYPMSTDNMAIPRRTGGVTVYAVGDNAAITASDKSWDQVQLTAKKWGALSQISSELNEDTFINIVDDMAREFAYAFAQKEDESLIDGDGTSTYNGVNGIRTKMVDGNHAGTTVDAAAGNPTFVLLDALDLNNLVAALPAYAQANAKFYCSSVAWTLTFERLMQAGGGNTFATIAAGAVKSYLGYPVVISQAMPTVTTTLNDLVMILFGDMSMAVAFGDRRGFELAVSTDHYFGNDALGVRGTTRFDINVHDVGDATTAGPLVGLLGTT